jgi:hypothetical protein
MPRRGDANREWTRSRHTVREHLLLASFPTGLRAMLSIQRRILDFPELRRMITASAIRDTIPRVASHNRVGYIFGLVFTLSASGQY